MAKQTFTTGQVLTAAQMTSLQQTAMGGGSTTAKTTSYVLVAADAGTTVAMNAAGSTTITVNTSLFSAGDSVFIQNWGAGTCTVTAGTATVTTHGSLALGQWEGGTLYFTSSSAAIFFDISQSAGMTNPMTTTGDTIYSSSGSTPARLGIGSTGNVLTVAGGVPTWAAPAGGGKVLQVISSIYQTNVSIASTSYNDTGLTASITPSASNSKILVMTTQGFYIGNSPDSGRFYMGYKLDRQIASGSFSTVYRPVDTTQNNLHDVGVTSSQVRTLLHMSYLDSPATTSSCTYKTVAQTNSTASGQSINFQLGGTDGQRGQSSIILMEIGA
jgi:hypothetical protein